jgi:large subunit ribosomal protein L4
MADQTNFQAAAYTQQGTQRDAVALPGDTFDGTVNMPVMHQAVKAFLANQRQANAHTKIRKYVTGGNQKPWKQKGTGRARQGSTRAPHWVGGGTVFGPTPRAYDHFVPRQVRVLAKKSALNARAREGSIIVIDAFNYDAPRTAALVALTARLDVADKKVLILTDGVKPNVFLSGRNLPNVHVMPFTDSSTYHILWSDVVLVEAGAIGQTLAPVQETAAALPTRERPAPTARSAAKRTGKPVTNAEELTPRKGGRKAAKQAAKKAAAKKRPTASAKKASKTTAKKSASKKSAAKKSTKRKEK